MWSQFSWLLHKPPLQPFPSPSRPRCSGVPLTCLLQTPHYASVDHNSSCTSSSLKGLSYFQQHLFQHLVRHPLPLLYQILAPQEPTCDCLLSPLGSFWEAFPDSLPLRYFVLHPSWVPPAPDLLQLPNIALLSTPCSVSLHICLVFQIPPGN